MRQILTVIPATVLRPGCVISRIFTLGQYAIFKDQREKKALRKEAPWGTGCRHNAGQPEFEMDQEW
jgi:hypothetical protein